MESESQSIVGWLISNGIVVAIIMAVTVVLQRFLLLFISRAIKRAVQSGAFATPEEEKKREKTLVSILDTISKVLLFVVAGLLILAQIGVDIAPLIAGFSVIGVALGFGMQSLVKDFVAGMFIIMENHYRIGDVVEVSGVSGVVQEISLRETVLRNIDGHVHHVPNGLIDVATNMTMEYSNIHIKIGVSYDSDIKKVEKVINDVGNKLSEDDEWKIKILEAPNYVRVDNFGPSEVMVMILGKVTPGDQWSVAGEFRHRLKEAFDKAGIEIPFPQRVIHQAKKK